MKNLTKIVTCAILISGCADNIENKELETEIDKVSYSVGVSMANSVKEQGLDSIDIHSVAKAFHDVFTENELALTKEESNTILQEYSQKLSKRVQAKKVREEQERTQANKKLLAENTESTITLPSGLQIEIIQNGEGESPTSADMVTVHYTGMLTNGEVFDSSVERGEPATFPVGGVIPGWTEALQLMQVGCKWKLTIPSDLAYGERGAGELIGPNETLIFEVELLAIESDE